jgi:hypothetical protein
MTSVEERVRAALSAHAEEFSAHPDAWQQLTARNRRRSRLRRPGRARPRPAWPAKAVIPAAAAAAVVAIVLAATMLVNNVSGGAGGSEGSGRAGAARTTPPPGRGSVYSPSGPAQDMLIQNPPVSAVIGLPLPWTGPGPKAAKVTGYFWIGPYSPKYWLAQIASGPQFCNDTVNQTTGQSAGFCWPLPHLGAGHAAVVTGREGVGTSQAILAGAAADTVASVAAVLPGGHSYPGTVKSGRGFAVKAWMVGYPINKGAHLVFRDASGKTVATLGTSGPDGPPQFPQPRSGGVTAFTYPAGDLSGPGGRVTAYLVRGRVGFWLAPSGGIVSPVPAAGPPALGGLILPFGQRSGENHPEIEEGFGYAHANVTRVVLYLPGGRTVSASTFAAGWSGSDLRLWAVGLPAGGNLDDASVAEAVTATGYDAAGHVVQRVTLGGTA